MNNQQLIKILNYDDLLSIVELLCIHLRNSNDDLDDLDELYTGWLPDEVYDYVKALTEYERLKLIQLIVNTLIHEAEQSATQDFQPLLPLGINRVNKKKRRNIYHSSRLCQELNTYWILPMTTLIYQVVRGQNAAIHNP